MPRRGIPEDENTIIRQECTHAFPGYFQSSSSLLLLPLGGEKGDSHQIDRRSLSENSICALKLDRMDKVYGQKTLAIPPILSIQMLFSDRLRRDIHSRSGLRKPSGTDAIVD